MKNSSVSNTSVKKAQKKLNTSKKELKTIKNTFNSDTLKENDSQTLELDISLSSDILSQENKRKSSKGELFKRCASSSDNALNVTFEESQDLTHSFLMPKQVQKPFHPSTKSSKDSFDENCETSQNLSNSFIMPKKNKILRRTKKNVGEPIDVKFEDSVTLEDSLCLQKNKVRPFSKVNNNKSNVPSVNFEESIASTISIPSQRNKNQLFPRQKRKSKQNSFDIGFEESAVSGSSMPIDKTKNKLFITADRNDKENSFDVSFEESVTSTSAVPVDKAKSKPFTKTNEKVVENSFSLIFNESMTADSVHFDKEKNQIFAKPDVSLEKNSFDVNFEESRNSVDGSFTQNEKAKPSNLSRKDTQENSFSLNFEETGNSSTLHHASTSSLSEKQTENSEKTEFNLDFEETNTGRDSCTRVSLPASKRSFTEDSSSGSEKKKSRKNLSSNSLGSASLKTESDTIGRNISTNMKPGEKTQDEDGQNVSLDDESFNDDNLNDWPSEILNESAEKNESLPREKIPPMEEEIPEETYAERQERMKRKFEDFVEATKRAIIEKKTMQPVKKPKKVNLNQKKICRNQKPRLKKPASFATKRLYDYLIKKLKPNFGLDSTLKAEELVLSMSETVKIVERRKAYQKKLVNDLKVEMAKAGIVVTTFDFYDFVREYLPHSFRVKVIPCIQPLTNIIYPPKDVKNAFDPIL